MAKWEEDGGPEMVTASSIYTFRLCCTHLHVWTVLWMIPQQVPACLGT